MNTTVFENVQEPPPAKLQFGRILVPTDLSPPSWKALHYAQALTSGAVQLLYVVEPPVIGAEAVPILLRDEVFMARVEAQLERATTSHGNGGPLSWSLRHGKPSAEIARLAREWEADLIVLSTHGRTGFTHLLLGSVAEAVVRHSPCPVLLLRKHEHDFVSAAPGRRPAPTLRRILVPVDFSERSAEAVRCAVDFAERFGGTITLLHSVYYPLQDFPGIDAEVLLSAREAAAQTQMRALQQTLPTALADRPRIVRGEPREEIPRQAVAGKFDLIVCATHGSAPVRQALFGSTAENIVRHAYCPVLIVPVPAARLAESTMPPVTLPAPVAALP